MIQKNEWQFNIQANVKSLLPLDEVDALKAVMESVWDYNTSHRGTRIELHIPDPESKEVKNGKKVFVPTDFLNCNQYDVTGIKPSPGCGDQGSKQKL